jgi:flagellar basal-body rod protein FlgG
MSAQQLQIDVIAHNLANVNTQGYKRARLEFQDLIYQKMRVAGTQSSRETEIPTGLQVGLGTRAIATDRSFSNGPLKGTENPLDLAIEGPGLFQIRLPGGEIAYTRDGAFKLDSRGQLVNSDGFPLDPPIVVPSDVTQVTVGQDGTVTATASDRSTNMQLGTIQLASVLNTGALEPMGKNLYRVTGNPSEIRLGQAGRDGMGTLAQGFLEGSNVKVVEEMIALIMGQRAYEANSKVIQTADRMLEDANRLR